MSNRVTFDVIANSRATGFDETNAKILKQAALAKKTSQDSQKDLKLLSTAIVGLGPAMIPIAAGAAALGAGLVGAASAGLLAFVGLRNEWKAGILQSTALGKQITSLQTNLHVLERTAASGVAPGFTAGLKDINGLMPLVNRDIAQLSAQLGTVAGNTGAGLVTLFHRLNPLVLSLGDQLIKGSAAFKQWATSSTGVTSFVAYAQAKLPEVIATLKDLVITASHIVQGFAPFGGVTLTALRLFAEALNKIPISLLRQLLPVLASMKIASTVAAALTNLSLVLGPLAIKLGLVAVAEGEVTTASRAMIAGFGPLAAATVAVVGGVELLKTSFPQLNSILSAHTLPAVDENTVGINALTNAYRDAHGGIDGTSQQLLAWGSKAANAKVVTGEYAASTDQLNGALASLRSQVGPTAASVTGLAGAQKAASVTIAGATTQIDAQTTAAGLLKDALDRLNGTAVSLEQTQNQFLDTLSNLTKRSKTYNGTLAQSNATGRANREVIVQALQAANDHAQAIANQTAKTRGLVAGLRAGSSDLAAHEAAIRRAASAAGLDAGQVNALIRQLGRIPRNVSSNIRLTGAQIAAGELDTIRSKLAALHDKHVAITLDQYTNIFQNVYKRVAMAGARATGGRVIAGKQYLVNEAGQELFVRDNDGASLIGGGPRLWKAPASGLIITAATVRSLRNRIGSLAGATLSQIPAAAASAIKAVANVLPFGSPITRALQAEDRQLEALVAHRAYLANRLKNANQQLADAQKRLQDAAKQWNQEFYTVQSAVTGSFDLLNAGKDVFGRTTAGGILSDLSGSVNNAKLFARDLQLLKGKIPTGVLRQLAEAGPSALPTLQALVGATPGQLRQFSALEGQLGAAGGAAGRTTADVLFRANIRAAQGVVRADERLIRSLLAQERATVHLERALRATIVKSVNITIHGGDARTIVRELEAYFARGGTVAGGRRAMR
jgi:hypothetical protein